MATNGAPDRWDDDMDTSNVTKKFSDLNVEAPSFVPNVNAAVFVPSWGAQPAAAPPPCPVVEEQSKPSQPCPPADTQTKMQVKYLWSEK